MEGIYWQIVMDGFPSQDNRGTADAKFEIPMSASWAPFARELGKKFLQKFPNLNLDRIGEKVHRQMIDLEAKGQPGLTGRGGKIPSGGTIKRYALTGLKAHGGAKK